MAVTKEKIITAVFENTTLSKAESKEAVERLMEILKRTLAEGTDVLISGFGKFIVKEKHERRGRNPQTREAMQLRARRVVVFKNSGQLRRRINGGKMNAGETPDEF